MKYVKGKPVKNAKVRYITMKPTSNGTRPDRIFSSYYAACNWADKICGTVEVYEPKGKKF